MENPIDSNAKAESSDDDEGCSSSAEEVRRATPAHETAISTDVVRNEPTVSSMASALVISACDKAGMEGIDRERIDAIILRESGDSAYMRQQRKRDKNVDVKIQQMKQRLADKDEVHCPSEWRRAQEAALEPEINYLLSLRRTRSTCVVVDMDSFYISCELLSRPELKDVPCCVGGSMILTSNYYARKYGVRSAMAGWIGDKLVSELSGGKETLLHIPAHFDLYTQLAHKVRDVLAEYDPNMRAYSLDEAYLDISPYLALKLAKRLSHEQIVAALASKSEESHENDSEEPIEGTCQKTDLDEEEESLQGRSNCDALASFPQELSLSVATTVVSEMRQKIQQATGGLTCSAGLACNFMLAKIASDRNKPNGQLVVGPSHEDVLSFIEELPTRKVPGIGRVTDKMLNALNISTVKDLYDQRAVVRFLFKPATAGFLLRASLGCSSSDGSTNDEESSSGQKGISRERTFQSGKPWAEVNSKLEDIARLLASDMRKKDLRAHTITLKVKLHTFDAMSRSRSMARGVYLQNADELVSLATEMLLELKKEHKGGSFSVRLLGVRCSNFQGEHEKADTSQMDIQKFLCKHAKSDQGSGKTNNGSMSPRLRTGAQSSSGTTPDGKVGKRQLNTAQNTSPESLLDETETVDQSHASVAATDDGEKDQVRCPMCNQPISGQDNNALNRHIDSCLSSSVVRDAVREESAATHERRKKKRLTDFFGAQSSTYHP